MNDLPAELFAAILKYTVHHEIGTPGNYQWSREPPVIFYALSIAQVCKAWWEFSLNMPLLWTPNGLLNSFLVEFALGSSSNHPLKLCLDFLNGFQEDEGDELQWDVIRNLTSQITRDSHLIVRVFESGHGHTFFSQLSRDALLLDRFEIYVHGCATFLCVGAKLTTTRLGYTTQRR